MKAGFGRSDLTPRLGVQLAGYGPYRNRAAKEILTPIFARAAVIEDGPRRVILLSIESCGAPRPLAERIRRAAAAAVPGAKPDDVFAGSTHSHSTPAVGGTFGWGELDALYVETLPARVAAAAAAAWAARTEVEWRHALAPCEGIAVNRETDAGFAMNADFAARMDPAWRPEHPEQTDPTVRVLAAYAGGRLVGLLHHFGCHPVVYGEKTASIHGDYPGLASLELERTFPGSVALFFPGALGDINPKLNHRVPAESKRAVRAIGRQYAAAVRRAVRAAQPVTVEGVRARRIDVNFSRKPWSRRELDRRIAELEKRFAQPGVDDQPFVGGKPPLDTNGMALAKLEGLRRVRAQFHGATPPKFPISLHAVKLGPVALLGCGLEAYHGLQPPVLAGSPHPHTWLVSLVGGIGYAPDRAAHERQGYAGDFVPVMVGELPFKRIHDELPRELVKLAKTLK